MKKEIEVKPIDVIRPRHKIAYISGRISGDENYRKKFARAEKRLIKQGYEVLNPATAPDGLSYDEYMEYDLSMLDRADVVFFLPDWILSLGCNIEWESAHRHDIEKCYLKPAKIWKVISTFLSYYATRKMKHISGKFGYYQQLEKIIEEAKELDKCDKRYFSDLTIHDMILLFLSIDPDFPIFYTSFVKNTPQEECADCFISLSGLRNVTDREDKRKQIRRRLFDLTEFCFSIECILHILLKLKYNQVRQGWKE